MGPRFDDHKPQPQTGAREPLVDLNAEPLHVNEARVGFNPRRGRLSGSEAENSTGQPQPPAKARRRSLAISETESSEHPSAPQPQPAPRHPPFAEPAAASGEQEPTLRPARSRGAITHPCDDLPGLQNILDPPRSVSEEPVPAPASEAPESESGPDPVKIQQFVAELRAKQSFSTALVGGLAVAIIAATAWALVTTATNYQIGWMAVGVGFLVGGAVRTLGRGIDKSFGYVGATMSVFGCLLGNLLSVCAIVASQESLSLVNVLAHVCAKPDLIPAALIATFHPLDLLFYGIAVYEGYRFSFRQVTDAEISRALCRQ